MGEGGVSIPDCNRGCSRHIAPHAAPGTLVVSIPQSGQRTFKRVPASHHHHQQRGFQSLNRDKGRSNFDPAQVVIGKIDVSIPQSGQRTFKPATSPRLACQQTGFNPSIGTKDVQTMLFVYASGRRLALFQSLNRDKGRSNSSCKQKTRSQSEFQSLNRDKGRSNMFLQCSRSVYVVVSIPQSGQRTFKQG